MGWAESVTRHTPSVEGGPILSLCHVMSCHVMSCHTPSVEGGPILAWIEDESVVADGEVPLRNILASVGGARPLGLARRVPPAHVTRYATSERHVASHPRTSRFMRRQNVRPTVVLVHRIHVDVVCGWIAVRWVRSRVKSSEGGRLAVEVHHVAVLLTGE
jgi:hypothetical protein